MRTYDNLYGKLRSYENDDGNLKARIEGWKAHAKHANSYNLVKRLNI